MEINILKAQVEKIWTRCDGVTPRLFITVGSTIYSFELSKAMYDNLITEGVSLDNVIKDIS